ncbi:MAG: Fe-Mn family superoxide dismutase [Patescibacteria group bacterium]
MEYEIKNFDNILKIQGFSNELLQNHFTLYQGYVNNFNKLNDILVSLEKENKFGIPEYAELNRRFGWEWNGMRLHELYFGNLTKEKIDLQKDSKFYKQIINEFGSYEAFEKDFKSMGAMRGIGWVILYYDDLNERLFNVWINEHDVGHFSGARPLLVMDVFEHAYMLDYGIKKAEYIEEFFKVINWGIVLERFGR